HAFTFGQRVVKRLDEPARSLNQNAVAHSDDRGHAYLQQLGSHGLRSLRGRCRLACFEEDERNAVIPQQWSEFVCSDCNVSAPFELAEILRILKAQSSQADRPVIDAVTIEMNDVIR